MKRSWWFQEVVRNPQMQGMEMESRNLKLLFFSTEDSEIKSLSLSFKGLIAVVLLIGIGIFTLTGVFTYLIVKFYQNYKIVELRRQNIVLVSQVSSMEEKLKRVETRLKELEKFDNDLRMLADLPKLDEDVRNVGVGGSESYTNLALEDLPDPINEQVLAMTEDLDKLGRQIDLEFASFREIENRLQENRTRIRHTPSIRPVMRGWLKSKFGYRVDPFLDIMKHHDGIDIAAEKGTPVYAPADGKVVAVGYDRNGYGRYVIIDHGYGIRTLFGHLSLATVKKGQKVKRWEKIGEVGRTGRATGYHLHYEVRVKDRPVDPLTYIFNW